MISGNSHRMILALLAIVLPSFRALHGQVDQAEHQLNQDGIDPDDSEGDGTGATCRS